MTKRLLQFFIFIGVLFGAGCDPIAATRVRLSLVDHSTTQVSTALDVSLDKPEIQDALRIIDEVVLAHGLARGQEHPGMEEVRGYGCTPRKDSTSQAITCRIYVRGKTLEVLFTEWMRWTSNEKVIEMRDDLRNKLIARYGKERVH